MPALLTGCTNRGETSFKVPAFKVQGLGQNNGNNCNLVTEVYLEP
jgi:hypothetical protein